MKQLEKLLTKYKYIHFVGIKGVGMAPLAIITKETGIKVTGSDISDEFITDWALKKAGIKPLVGFSDKHITPPVGGPDLVITTGAHGGFDNPEVEHARYTGIPVMAQGEAVGEFMRGEILGREDIIGISVAGSHGKTTITAMLATILSKNNLDPSYIVGTGSINKDWLPGHYGRGQYFVAEADEYANEPKYDKTPKFLYQQPKMIIMPNIEFDHPDIFGSIDDVREAFLKFVTSLPRNGTLIACGDDPQINKILPQVSSKVITYGRTADNDLVLTRVSQNQDKTYFWVEQKNVSLGEFMLGVPGAHNALNAVAVIANCLELGISVDSLKKTLPTFTGSKRRFEFVGQKEGILFYDDYAHHPTEIKTTLKLAKTIFPKKKIICIFQPHTFSRTRILFNEFVHSFGDATDVIIIDIYPSLREEPDPAVSSRKLVLEMNKIHPNVRFLSQAGTVVEYIDNKIAQGDFKDAIIITMGAGDVYKIAISLLASSV